MADDLRDDPGLADAVALLRGRPVTVVTGAGVSTDSGIPDYRGQGRSPRRSIQYREFVTSAAVRARYWARSALGWPTIAAARPNPTHHAIAQGERAGVFVGLITQNVDGLHGAAGSRAVELHGALARVRCLGCGDVADRAALQARIVGENAAFLARARAAAATAPDGDADLPDDALAGFAVPACARCGGVLKPDVVLFGEHVPADVTAQAWAAFERAAAAGGALLVAGSSLAVFSGYRFVVRAAERGVPVAIVNRGATRGDPLAAVRVDASLGAALPALVAALTA